MARLLPDPAFHPSPSLAAEAGPLALGQALVVGAALGAAALIWSLFTVAARGAGVLLLPFVLGRSSPKLDTSAMHYHSVPVEVHSGQPGLTVASHKCGEPVEGSQL